MVLLHVEEVPESERVRVILCETGKSDGSNIASNENSDASLSTCIQLATNTEPPAETATNGALAQLPEHPTQPMSGCARVPLSLKMYSICNSQNLVAELAW